MNTRYLCPHGGDLLDKTVRSVSRSVSRPGISLPTTHVIMTLNFSYLCVQDGCFDASSRTSVADHRFPWLVVARPGHRSHTTLSYTFHSHATLLHRSLPRTTLSRTLLRHTYLSHTTLPPTAFERKKLFLHTHPFHMQHFRAQLFYTHLRQLLHATLSHTTLSHIAHFRIQLFKTIDPPASPLSFVPLQTGRSWLVGLSGPWIFASGDGTQPWKYNEKWRNHHQNKGFKWFNIRFRSPKLGVYHDLTVKTCDVAMKGGF